MKRISSHLYLERRRLMFVAVLAFLSGNALFSHVGGLVLGMSFPVFAGALYAVLAPLGAAVTTFVLPRFRRLTDAISVSRLAFAIWVILVQGQAVAAVPLYSATIVVAGGIALRHASFWMERLSRASDMPVVMTEAILQVRGFFDWVDNAAARGVAPERAPITFRTVLRRA